MNAIFAILLGAIEKNPDLALKILSDIIDLLKSHPSMITELIAAFKK